MLQHDTFHVSVCPWDDLAGKYKDNVVIQDEVPRIYAHAHIQEQQSTVRGSKAPQGRSFPDKQIILGDLSKPLPAESQTFSDSSMRA